MTKLTSLEAYDAQIAYLREERRKLAAELSKLSPCPFCGGKKLRNRGTRVTCEDCYACGPFRGDFDAEDAEQGWNGRARSYDDED